MSHSIEPLALILDAFFGIDVLALAVSEAILDLSFIGGAIWPLVTADTSDFIASELASVRSAVGPAELALAMEEPVLDITLVGVAIPELASALAMVNFTDLKDSKISINHPLLKSFEIESSWNFKSLKYILNDCFKSRKASFICKIMNKHLPVHSFRNR